MSLVNKLIDKTPHSILIRIKYPKSIITDIKLNKWLKMNYQFEICFEEEADNYHQIFYNWDERSNIGWVTDHNHQDSWIDLRIFPKYYVKGWEVVWKKLLTENTIIAHKP